MRGRPLQCPTCARGLARPIRAEQVGVGGSENALKGCWVFFLWICYDPPNLDGAENKIDAASDAEQQALLEREGAWFSELHFIWVMGHAPSFYFRGYVMDAPRSYVLMLGLHLIAVDLFWSSQYMGMLWMFMFGSRTPVL